MPEQSHTSQDKRNSVGNTLRVAIGLSVICSILVAGTAVTLKPKQLQNETDYRQRIILEVAGLYEAGTAPNLEAAGIEARIVDLASGDYVDDIDASSFDPLEAANNPDLAVQVPEDLDIAHIRRRAIYAPVYLVRANDRVEQIILPIYGSGLWSTMYGYIALDGDANTVRGLRFYEHGETPGLGDQMDKPEWRVQWEGKQLFSRDMQPQLVVVRGAAIDEETQIDGLAGATLTGRGVMYLVHYWAGEHGFGPYLQKLQREGTAEEPRS